ncbi:histidine phosphatase family protein [Tateyamaria sp.]|uniref:histidine phosphatase family protein n=1 Tax=Tateyamaria sp. TaxID=1929288 RepID=UPI003B22757D
MTRLALLRHGHTAWNRAGRIQGRTDIPLDDVARAHLAELRLPHDWQEADLVSSPLSRAVETGQIVARRQPMAVAALMEMDWGDWEGRKGLELKSEPGSAFRDIEAWGWDYCPPGGEPPTALRARLSPWVEALERDTVAVCHIGVMRVLMAMATGWNFSGPAPFQIKRDRLFVLHIQNGNLSAEATPVRLLRGAS